VITAPDHVKDIQRFEQCYWNDKQQEHAALYDTWGNLVIAKVGDIDSVTFSLQELNRACGGLLTHGHPHGKPFSSEDLALAARNALIIRAFGTTPDGEAWLYEAHFQAPSEQIARTIEKQFDELVIGYTARLGNNGLNPYKVEREARNLAIFDLSQALGFTYSRYRLPSTVTSIHEMKPAIGASHEELRLDNIAQVENVMRDQVFAPISAEIAKLLVLNGGAKGIIPLERIEPIRQQVYALVSSYILGKPRPDGTLQPYLMQHGRLTPNSPYFATLYTLMRQAAAIAVDQQASIMREHMPQDLQRAFEYATLNPYATHVHEQLAPKVDPLHLWVGRGGKRLVDSIWNVAGDTFRKLDMYITQAIQQSKSVQTMVGELESSLLPGRVASDETGTIRYEPMRLARTEVSAAGSRAGWAAAQKNPYVVSYNPFTAPQHKCCDQCDIEEKNGPYDIKDPDHLPPFHPHCIDGVRWNVADEPDAITLSLREQINQALSNAKTSIADWIGPLSKKFIGLLFGETL